MSTITHVVMFRLEDRSGGSAESVKGRLDALPAKISEIRSYDVGLNVVDSARAFDVVLVSTFDSWDDLRAYQAHPSHIEVASFIASAAATSATVDYET